MKRTLTALTVASLAGVMFAATGCQMSEAKLAEAQAINTTCPGSGEPVTDDSYVQYKGKKVAFCCDQCKDAWENKMTDDDRKAFVKETMAMK